MIPDPAWKSGPPDEEEEDTRDPNDDACVPDFDPREEKAWDAVRDYEQELEREPW